MRWTSANLKTGGGIFDTGPGFVFNLGGGPGIRVHQFGGGRPRRRPGTAQPPGSEPQQSISSALSSLLPLLLLFVLPLLSSFFSGSSTPQGPSVSFEKKPPYTLSHTSTRLGVPYFVNPTDVEGYNTKAWNKLDGLAETRYVHQLNLRCEYEHQEQQKAFQDAQGWFLQDERKMQQARNMEMPNCKKLRKMGVRY